MPGTPEIQHAVAFDPPNRFAGWPANNGLWAWDDGELLVGCSVGTFCAQTGHSVTGPIRSVLLRSLDGLKWSDSEPEGYLNAPAPLAEMDKAVDFAAHGFAMRVVGTGYHGTDEPRGGFYLSSDRGHTWSGPFGFRGLTAHPALHGLEMTPRTDYLVNGPADCTVFLSGRSPSMWGADRVFCARTTDGGQTFAFVSWVVPPSDPYRAVMPCTVRCPSFGPGPGKLVTAVRRRDMRNDKGWVDAYDSVDGGSTWSFLARIADTGGWNGNPPALTRPREGRLCCVYGHRNRRQMVARYSLDEGHTWGREWVLREDFQSVDDEPDLGYPRLVERPDGRLLALYYWATRENPQQHIAATLWQPHDPG